MQIESRLKFVFCYLVYLQQHINRQTLPQGQKVKQNLQQKHNKSQLQLSTQC